MHSFTRAAKVKRWSEPVWCQLFVQTLTLVQLPTCNRIDGFQDLKQQFMAHFGQQRKCTRDPLELHYIMQSEGESLRDYMERYKQESITISDADERQRISGFIHGIRTRQLVKKLGARVPKSLQDAYERCEEYVRGEEAAAAPDNRLAATSKGFSKNSTPRPNQDTRRTTHHASDRHRQERRQSGFTPYEGPTYERPNNAGRPDDRRPRFTPLIKIPQEVLATEDARYKFKPARPITGTTSGRDMAKYCEFHMDRGHETNECYALRKEIEAVVKSGELAHLVKEVKDNDKGGRRKDKQAPERIHMVSSYSNKKPKVRGDAWANWTICFPPLNHVQPTLEPMIITA